MSARERARRAEKEASFLVGAIVACLVVLPLEAAAPIKMVLYASIAFLEILYLLIGTRRAGSDILVSPLLGPSTLLFVYLVLCWIVNGGPVIERLVQTSLFLLTFLVFSEYDWSAARIARLKSAFGLLMLAAFVYWALTGRQLNYYAAFYGHGNGFAVVVLAASAIALLTVKQSPRASIVMLMLCAFLLAVANSRASVGAFIMLLVGASLFGVLSRRRNFSGLAKRCMVVVLVFVLGFAVVYPSLYGTQLGMTIELASREYLNKNFFSGREVVWRMVLDAVDGHEMFGLGLGVTPSDIYDTEFSSHNLYLQTVLQSGLVGLALVIWLLWIVVDRLGRRRNWAACVGVAFVLAMLIHECFEVSLTQNNFEFGLLSWVVMGVALSASAQNGADVGLQGEA